MARFHAQTRRHGARANPAADLPGPMLAAAAILLTYSVVSTQNVAWESGRSREITVSVTRLGEPACADLWWVKAPGGGIEPVGLVCGTRAVKVPGGGGLPLWSMLRGSVVPGVRIAAVQGKDPRSVDER